LIIYQDHIEKYFGRKMTQNEHLGSKLPSHLKILSQMFKIPEST